MNEEKIAILGLGLMGGSLAAALKSVKYPGEIIGYARREEVREYAIAHGMCDRVTGDPVDAVKGATIVVACLPICTIPKLIMECRNALQPKTIITDVGSTKANLMTEMRDVLAGTEAVFIGSHPICGSEQSGIEAARCDLYKNALVVVTGGNPPVPEYEERICAMWKAAGGITRMMDHVKHDEMLARMSHLPHFAAACLVMATTDGLELDTLGTFAGTGFMDSTRIAEGAPEIWRDILATNREPIVHGLTRLRGQVEEILRRIQDGGLQEVETYLEESRSRRQTIRLQREQIQGDRDGACHRSEEC